MRIFKTVGLLLLLLVALSSRCTLFTGPDEASKRDSLDIVEIRAQLDAEHEVLSAFKVELLRLETKIDTALARNERMEEQMQYLGTGNVFVTADHLLDTLVVVMNDSVKMLIGKHGSAIVKKVR